jgi:hypothetical protein
VLTSTATAVGLVFLRHASPDHAPPAIAPVDDWAAQGVRFAHEGADGAKLRITAGTVASAAVRFGVFSIGFVQRVEATGVEIAIELGAAREPRDLGFDVTTALGAIVGPGARGRRFASGHIDGLVVRIAAPGAPTFELRAARCDVRRRIFCRDHVVVRTGDADLTFSALVYDVANRRFVDGDAPGARGSRGVEIVNAALRELVRPAS